MKYALYTCALVAELPIPFVDSKEATCSGCGESIWVDPVAYRRRVYEGFAPVLVCRPCTAEVMAEVGRGEPVHLPYDPRLEALCPSCGSPGTEYHPAELYGRCHTCGFRWIMDAGGLPRTYGEHHPVNGSG